MEISLRLTPKEIKEKNSGLELAIRNDTKESRGVQVGGVNYADESYGVQVGGVNYAFKKLRGVQVGGVNYAFKKLRGVQIAPILNICGEDSVGVQLGALNWRKGVPWYAKLIPVIAVRKLKKKSLDEKVE